MTNRKGDEKLGAGLRTETKDNSFRSTDEGLGEEAGDGSIA